MRTDYIKFIILIVKQNNTNASACGFLMYKTENN